MHSRKRKAGNGKRIIFTPATEMKEVLSKTSVIITCYDRDGKEVKRVTSTDPGTVEDENGNANQNENGSGQSGSQSGSTNTGNQGGDEGGGGFDMGGGE